MLNFSMAYLTYIITIHSKLTTYITIIASDFPYSNFSYIDSKHHKTENKECTESQPYKSQVSNLDLNLSELLIWKLCGAALLDKSATLNTYINAMMGQYELNSTALEN